MSNCGNKSNNSLSNKQLNKFTLKQSFHQRLNEARRFTLKGITKIHTEAHTFFFLSPICHTLIHCSFAPLLSTSAVLCLWFGTGAAGGSGDLGLVNTSIINLNRNEPGQLWRHLRLEGTAVNLRHCSPLHHSVNLSLPTSSLLLASQRLHSAARCLFYTRFHWKWQQMYGHKIGVMVSSKRAVLVMCAVSDRWQRVGWF